MQAVLELFVTAELCHPSHGQLGEGAVWTTRIFGSALAGGGRDIAVEEGLEWWVCRHETNYFRDIRTKDVQDVPCCET